MNETTQAKSDRPPAVGVVVPTCARLRRLHLQLLRQENAGPAEVSARDDFARRVLAPQSSWEDEIPQTRP